MAGCECEIWRAIKNPKNQEEEKLHRKLRKHLYWDDLCESWILFRMFILNCPWCGSLLTPPKEAGDETD